MVVMSGALALAKPGSARVVALPTVFGICKTASFPLAVVPRKYGLVPSVIGPEATSPESMAVGWSAAKPPGSPTLPLSTWGPRPPNRFAEPTREASRASGS